jgi:hypothetical protein
MNVAGAENRVEPVSVILQKINGILSVLEKLKTYNQTVALW